MTIMFLKIKPEIKSKIGLWLFVVFTIITLAFAILLYLLRCEGNKVIRLYFTLEECHSLGGAL
jgi:hypothetical protein